MKKIKILYAAVLVLFSFYINEHRVVLEADEVNNQQSIEDIKKSASAGDKKAQLDLASAYMEGDRVPQSFEKSIEWIKKALNKKYPRAEYAMGVMYMSGKGVPLDYQKAVEYFEKAMDEGYGQAANNLAVIFRACPKL